MSEKNEDERLQKIIKACKIIADIMPNDSINESVKASIPEILPKLIKMMPHLITSVIHSLNRHRLTCFSKRS